MKNRRTLVALAFLLLLLGGIGTAVTYASYDPVEVQETAVNDGEGITGIDIRVNNEKLIVLPSSEETFRAELQGSGKARDKDRLSMKKEGGNLVIGTERQRNPIFSFNFLKRSLTLTVYVPERMYERLDIEVDNGAIEVHDLQAKQINASSDNGRVTMRNIISDKASISTSNGRVELRDIASSELNAHSNNGKIIMQKVEADALQFTTNNGRIELDAVNGELRGRTNNGGISVKTDHMDRQMDLETDNGSIEIQTENEPTNAILDVRTDNGKVTIFDQENWNSVIGDGENQIKLNTNNGSITVRR